MIKKLLLLFPLLFPSVSFSQSICDSIFISPKIVYLNQLEDSAAFVSVTYTGQSNISYSTCEFIFTDSAYIDINEKMVTSGVGGPFTFMPKYGYKIIYNKSNIPPNTIVNAQFRIYRDMDCLMPVTFIINSTTGINESHSNVQFQLFPNPANKFLFVESGASGFELSIYDMAGRKVLDRTLTNVSSFIDISKLSEGIYIVVIKNNSISNNNISLIKRIVKLK